MTQLPDDIFLYDMRGAHDGERHFYLSPLPPEHGFTVGLRPEAIMGELTNGPDHVAPEHFKQNPVFIKFLVWVISKHARECPWLITETTRQQNGFVYIIDKRMPTSRDAVLPEDIIAAVEIHDGQMQRIHGSPNYRVFTKDGFMQLEDWFRERLLEELAALPNE